jgi:hypothetical protein
MWPPVCPECHSAIQLRKLKWYQRLFPNVPFRCPNCAAMLTLKPSRRLQVFAMGAIACWLSLYVFIGTFTPWPAVVDWTVKRMERAGYISLVGVSMMVASVLFPRKCLARKFSDE